MAYGLDVPLTLAALAVLGFGVVVVLIVLAKGGSGSKKPRGKDSSSKKPTSSKKPAAPAKDSKKKPAAAGTPKTEKKAEKKAATPKTEKKEVKKSDPKPSKKADQPAASTPETPAKSPKVETLSKTERKKQAKRAAKAVVVEKPEEASAEDIEFARAMSTNAKSTIGGGAKKKEEEAAQAEAAEQSSSGGARDWAEINAKKEEVQQFKAKLKESEKEITSLRRIIDENKKKMREYNLTNAKLVSERTAQKEAYEEKIARLKADIEARRENRDVNVKSGDALRDRNYVVNVLQQEKDRYQRDYAELQAAYSTLQKELQKQSEGDSEKHIKQLQQQVEALSEQHNTFVNALQDAKQAEAAVRDQLQAERVNVAKLTALLESSSASSAVGKEDAPAEEEDTNGKEEVDPEDDIIAT